MNSNSKIIAKAIWHFEEFFEVAIESNVETQSNISQNSNAHHAQIYRYVCINRITAIASSVVFITSFDVYW